MATAWSVVRITLSCTVSDILSLTVSRDTDHANLDVVCHSRLILFVAYLSTKFEDSSFTVPELRRKTLNIKVEVIWGG